MTNPKYPVYIVSKGRSDSMLTSRQLQGMNVPHRIAIENHEVGAYEKALERYNLTHATLLVLPFSNHGQGPGRARNACWDHSISLGAEYHWVMDDNIFYFFRLYKGTKIPCNTGYFFRTCEEFTERYENVPLSGLNYSNFCPRIKKKPPITVNTRIYSSLLIRNDCPFRWRGRYNEDTDLSLRVLKSGDCTIQFNHYLQDKVATQRIKGGNTEEFYHKENFKEDNLHLKRVNPDGTLNKSRMLVEMHPDVCKLVWRFNRWHHDCDYSVFAKNQLRLKPEWKEKFFDLPKTVTPLELKRIVQ